MESVAETATQTAIAMARRAQRHCESRLPTYLTRLAALVSIDSGPDHRKGRDEAAGLLADWVSRAGVTVEMIDRPAGLFVHATLAGDLPGRVVLLGHHDTVFPLGSVADHPFALRDTIAYGPGTADMKGGLLVALATLEALLASGLPFPTVELHSVPDEEARTVPFATMDRVSGADAVLVFECGRTNGNFVSGRKTGAWVRVAAHGRSAHAGTEPGRGRSAVLGLCREILRCSELHSRRSGLTVTAGTLAGGTIPNVVPAEAEAVFDVRAEDGEDLRWALQEMAAFDRHDGLRIELDTIGDWPGIEPTPAGERLARAAADLGDALGVHVAGETTGGMSDGCWTAAAGIPTLDGLGPVGGHDHSPDEYIDVNSVAQRCGIAAGLTVAIGAGLLG
ncbi:MAG TPA: M20/M25/M40 family metallo-hydrolase [Thermoleophilia bacterium]|nr:M20/M25/M40 family metallo-hydrolase [Thermoleophilia bacterium]